MANATNWSSIVENKCSFKSFHSEKEKIIQVSVLSALLLLSLLGNFLVIFVILRNKTLRKGNNLFFLNMAISDMLVPLMVLPHYIVVYYTRDHTWPLDGVMGDLTCKMYKFLENISPCVSILTLIYMTIDRFCAIVLATRRNLITSKVRKYMIISTWIISSATSFPYLYAARVERRYFGRYVLCVFKWSDSHSMLDNMKANNIYMTFNLVFFFIFPVALLTVLYCIILVRLKHSKRMLSSRSAKKRMQVVKRITYMAVIIVGVFLIFWGPYFTLMTLVAFYWKWSTPPICSWSTIILTVRFLTFSHAAVNPFICFTFVRTYRSKIAKVFSKASAMSLWFTLRSLSLRNHMDLSQNRSHSEPIQNAE